MSATPATRIEVFDVPLPALRSPGNPLETPTNFAPAELVGVELVFPDGCAGLVGVRLAVGHGQAIPATAGGWVIGNNETLSYPLAGQLNNGAWSVVGYNQDVYVHTVHVRFLVADFGSSPGTILTAPAMLPALG